MLKQFRHLETDISIYDQENEEIELLQSDKKYPLSQFYSNNGTVKAIINCSYSTNEYVLGCNQGDLKNDTHDQKGFWDLKFTKDGKYHLGQFKSWDYKENVVAGFSVATVLIKDGKDVSLISDAIENVYKITKKDPQTSVAVLDTGKIIFIVVDGRTSANKGLTGYELREFVKNNYPNVELLCQLDGGGSSEMIVDGKIVNKPSDGRERPMFNGLALITPKQEEKTTNMDTVMFPCKEGWDSQTYHSGHKAIDIGWLKSQSSNGQTPILACADGVVEVADFYKETVNSVKVKPIVCIIRHETKENTWYSAYWHLAKTPKNKGDIVKMGDEIGTKGNTGYSGGVHLHFVLMKCPKGTPVPKSHDFNKYAVNPIDYIRVYPNQIFEYKGNYDLQKYVAPSEPEQPIEDIASLKEEIALLTAQNIDITNRFNALSEKNKQLDIKIMEAEKLLTDIQDAIEKYFKGADI